MHVAGLVGIAVAFNESIRKWLILATLLSLGASLVAAGIMVRSVVGPVILMLPVRLGTIIWVGLVYMIGIEFNSNVTSALSIASGGVLFRFREDYVGDVGFTMALVLLLTFTCSCIVVPVVWSLLQPKFVTRGVERVGPNTSEAA